MWAPWTQSNAAARGAEQPADRVGFPADYLQGAVEAIVVVPDQPVGALTDLARPLVAVDDEHARPADYQTIHVRLRAWNGQVVKTM